MARQATNPDYGAVGPIRVTVLTANGAPSTERCVEGLVREVIDVSLETPEVLEEPPEDERSVVVVWLPPGVNADFYERVVEWVSGASEPVAVLGVGVESQTHDAETALAAGFDDFMASRFSPRELAARVRALHRRIRLVPSQRRDRQRYGRFVLDSMGHQLWIDGKSIPLTATELGVMSALVGARGQALPRARILDSAWGDGNFEVSERAVDNVILRLRRKLGDPGLIETVRGVGFRLANS